MWSKEAATRLLSLAVSLNVNVWASLKLCSPCLSSFLDVCVCVCKRRRQRETVGRCCLRGVTHLTIVTHYRMLNGSPLTCARTQTRELIVTGEDMKEPHEGKTRHTERNTSAPRSRAPLALWSQLSEMARCSAHWVGAYITPVHTSFLCRLTRWTEACHFFFSLCPVTIDEKEARTPQVLHC